jgi:alkyldihydroxyacetonephosphate synthase
VLEIDTENGQVKAEAGVLGGELEQALGERGWTTWFSPQSLHRSTIGGWVATGASGQFSSRFGGIEDSIVALTVVLADGREVRLGTPPRGAVGPDLKRLFVGSEGALGIITEVTLRIAPLTPLSGVSAFVLPSVDAGLGVLKQTMQQALRPLVLRLYDEDEARHLVGVPLDAPVLLAAFTGIAEVAAAEEAAFRAIVESRGGKDIGPAPAEAWLAGRYDFSRIEALLASPGGYAETIEIAGSWREMPRIHRAMKEALAPLADEVLGHFSHTYSNGTSLYLIVLGRAADDGEAVERLQQVWSIAMEAALASNAVISHHHGLGRARMEYLARQLGEGVHVLDALKNALDPHSILHPGILTPVPSRMPPSS